VSQKIADQYPFHSVIGLPLIAANQKLGIVIIAFNTLHKFPAQEIERAEQAGNQVALALWNFQQSLEIQHRLKESNALARIGRALSETERVGTDKVLQLIVDSARELIEQADESVIHIMDSEEQTLVPRAISEFDAGTIQTSQQLNLEKQAQRGSDLHK
jgi:GAF domain-containing protein